jgi:hypothetical protein
LLLAVSFLSLPASVGAQGTQGTGASAAQSPDEYEYRLVFFIVQKLEKSTDNPSSDALAQAARGLFAPEKQEQIRKDLERRIGSPGNPKRAARYDALLSKIDRNLTDRKIRELREDMAKKGRADSGWSWPLCVIAGCR